MACNQTYYMSNNAPKFDRIFIISKLRREPPIPKIVQAQHDLVKD